MTKPHHGPTRLLALVIALFALVGCEFDDKADQWEFIFGPTNVRGALGNGGLSAAFSGRGEVTVLRWPSPSYTDHLSYLTPVFDLAAREKPRLGAEPNMGIFAGLVLRTGGATVVTWLRDDPWVSTQRYRTDDSNVLVTDFTHPELHIDVTLTSFVPPDRDVLVLRYAVTARKHFGVDEASLIVFENLAPCLDMIPNLPVADWLLDSRNDFAALYDSREDALVHFRPDGGKGLLCLLDPLLADPPPDIQTEVNAFVDDLDGTFGDGVYIAVGSPRRSAGHQVGFDAHRACTEGPSWGHEAEDAYLDAGTDGVLSGSPVAACQANAAFAWDLDLSDGGDAVTVHLAFSDHAGGGGSDGALDRLAAAREEPYGRLLGETDVWWSDWLSRARLPKADPCVERVAKRTLISIKTGTDRETGAIVASLSVQPPYALDWPRDGAFINHALDLAGYPEMVTRHNLFYAQVQRKEPLRNPLGEMIAPAGTFATNYYADGTEGGPIPFEIDNAGLAVWTLADHRTFLEGAERAAYLEAVWPAIRLGATELARCRDEATGLQCYANEDDNPVLTRTLQGAVAVYTALTAALEAAGEVGETGENIELWSTRREELREAILDTFWLDARGHFDGGERHPRRPGAWLIWPARLLPYDDPRMKSHARYLFELVAPNLRKETAGSLYDSEAIMALARIWKTGEDREKIRWALRVLTRELPTEGTHHFSEAYSVIETDRGKAFLNRNAVPHIWSASLTYLASMEAEVEGAPAGGGGEARCGCVVVPAGEGARPGTIVWNGLVWIVPPLVVLGILRRWAG